MVDIKWVEFHTPVFHPAGKNFGTKIEVSRFAGLKVQYDSDHEVFYMDFPCLKTGKVIQAVIPRENAALWTNQEVVAVVNEHKTEDKSKRSKAQVATPQSHVFEGRGQGKS